MSNISTDDVGKMLTILDFRDAAMTHTGAFVYTVSPGKFNRVETTF